MIYMFLIQIFLLELKCWREICHPLLVKYPQKCCKQRVKFNPHIIIIIFNKMKLKGWRRYTTATDLKSWFNAKGQLVISKVPWATLMRIIAEFLASAKPSNPLNTKLMWSVEGMRSQRKSCGMRNPKHMNLRMGCCTTIIQSKIKWQGLLKVSRKLA